MSGLSKVTPKEVALLNQTVKSLGDKPGLQSQIRQLNRGQREVVIRATNIAQKILEPVNSKVPNAYELSYIEEATVLLQINRNRPPYGFLKSIRHIFSNIFGSRIASSTVISKIEAFKTAANAVGNPTDKVDLKAMMQDRKKELETKKSNFESLLDPKQKTRHDLIERWKKIETLLPTNKEKLSGWGNYVLFQAECLALAGDPSLVSDENLKKELLPLVAEIPEYIKNLKESNLESPVQLKIVKMKSDAVSKKIDLLNFRSDVATPFLQKEYEKRIKSLEKTLYEWDHSINGEQVKNANAALTALKPAISLIQKLEDIHNEKKLSASYFTEMKCLIDLFSADVDKRNIPETIKEVKVDFQNLRNAFVAPDADKNVDVLKALVVAFIKKYKDKINDLQSQSQTEKDSKNNDLQSQSKAEKDSKKEDKKPVSTSSVSKTDTPRTKKQRLEDLAKLFDELKGSPKFDILSEFGLLTTIDRDKIHEKFYLKLPTDYEKNNSCAGRGGEVGFVDYTNIPDNKLRAAAIREYAKELP